MLIGKTTFPNDQTYTLVFEGGATVVSGNLPANQWQMEYILTDSNGTRTHNQSTNVIVTADGSYHHFALTYNGAGSPTDNVKLYVDGVLQATNIPFGNFFSGNLKSSPAEPFRINADGSGSPFSADEVSVYNRALSAPEIAAIANAGTAGECQPTATTAPTGLVAWFAGDGNANDISGNNNNGAFVGNSSFAIGRVGQDFNFTGSQSVQAPDNASLDFTNAFTIGMWVKPTAEGAAGGETFFISKGVFQFVGTQFYGIGFTPDRRVVNRVANGSTLDNALSTSQLPLNTFTHIATTYDGDTLRIYINGVLDITPQATTTSHNYRNAF